MYFDKAYHNETTARLWWDDHKSFFDTREQLMQYLLLSSRRTLKQFASRMRRSTKGRGSHPPAPNRRTMSPPPAEYAAASAAAAEGPPGGVAPPDGDATAAMRMHGAPEYAEEPVGPEGEGGSGRAFESAMAYVAQQAPDVDTHGGVHVREDDGLSGLGGVCKAPPSAPLV